MAQQGLMIPSASPSPMVQVGRTYADRPMIRRITNEEIEQQKLQEQEATFQQSQNKPVTSALASHIRAAFTSAISAKQTIMERLLKCDRQCEGVYEADIKQMIDASGGTEIYMMVTDAKCRGLESWLCDIMIPATGEKPYSVEPTPIPDIPPQLVDKARMEFMQDYIARIEAQAGGVFHPSMLNEEDLRQAAESFKGELLTMIKEIAKEDALAQENQIEDEFREGGWYKALKEFIEDFSRYPTAFIEGPLFRRRKVMDWQPVEGTMISKPVVIEKIVKEYRRLDPYDVYPSPGSKTIQDGDLCIRERFTRRDLEALIGVEGYSEAAIKQVLKQYGDGGFREFLSYDTEIADLRNRPQEYQDREGHIDGIKFFGSAQGFKLREWGMGVDQIPDPFKEYPVVAHMVGHYVIGARLNYHPLGRRNIFSASFRGKNGSIWGKSPPELMRDCQNICNSSARAICNNAAFACLTGDTVVYREGQKHGRSEVTLSELWKRKNSNNSGLRRTKLRSLDEETGKFFSNRVVDIIDNGITKVFEVVTGRGYKIKATGNHRFMRDDGEWQLLDDFDEGELIAVNGQVLPIQGVCVECGGEKSVKGLRCRKCASQFNNSEWNQRQADKARLSREGSETTARGRKVCRIAMKEFCEDCSARESKGGVASLHQHHQDRDPWNNEPENLVTLCAQCHRERHTREDSYGNPYLHKYVSYDRIVSITYVGEEQVFDLVMTGPNHNFIANGFVSHNSGPQVWQYVDLIPPEEDRTNIFPFKIWSFSSEKLAGASRDPIGFFQPQLIVNELLNIYKYFFDQASEATGIPAYMYGNENIGGAGATASGLSMLMNAAAKGLRNAAANIDGGVISPSVEEHRLIIMLMEPEKANGDIRIVARASSYLIQQEQLQMRRQEFLTATNNPTDLQITGLEGRAEVLRENAKSLKMNVDKIVPKPEDMFANRVQQEIQNVVMKLAQNLGVDPNSLMAALQSQPGQEQSGGAGSPEETDPAGNPMAGQDVRMFNQ